MRKMILGGFTALLLGTAALVPQAEARCWWNGFAWNCSYPHRWWGPHTYWWHPWHHRYYHHYAWYGHHRPYAWRY
jgi:hypothetical protein